MTIDTVGIGRGGLVHTAGLGDDTLTLAGVTVSPGGVTANAGVGAFALGLGANEAGVPTTVTGGLSVTATGRAAVTGTGAVGGAVVVTALAGADAALDLTGPLTAGRVQVSAGGAAEVHLNNFALTAVGPVAVRGNTAGWTRPPTAGPP